ncbi:MAG: Gfo/Idh/MocA family oxidoreductase, partial [Candidatus Bathyarchaeia archaeon]
MTIETLENGYNLIVEKPPAATIQDLDEMLEAERKSGKFCAVGFQFLYMKTVRKLKEYICDGKLGEIEKVLVKGKWKRQDSYYERTPWAGKFIYNGQYVLDGTINNPLAHFLMNSLYFASRKRGEADNPKLVRAELYRGHQIEGEDTSCL